jgi:hypothetical protein
VDAPYVQLAPYEEGILFGSSVPSVEFKEKILNFINEDGWIIQDCRFVVWTSSALGMAERGKQYLCVMTPGYQVVLGKGEKRMALHTDLEARQIVVAPDRTLSLSNP